MSLEEAFEILGLNKTEILALSQEEALQVVKKKRRELSRKHHPDNFATSPQNIKDFNEKKMKDINAASDIIEGYLSSLTQTTTPSVQTTQDIYTKIEQAKNEYKSSYIADFWKDIQLHRDRYDKLFLTYYDRMIKNIDEVCNSLEKDPRLMNFIDNINNVIESNFKGFIKSYCEVNNLPYSVIILRNSIDSISIIMVMGIPFYVDCYSIRQDGKYTNLYQIYQKLEDIYKSMELVENIFLKHLGGNILLEQLFKYYDCNKDMGRYSEMEVHLGKRFFEEFDFSYFNLDNELKLEDYIDKMYEVFIGCFSSLIGKRKDKDVFIETIENEFNQIKLDFIQEYCETYKLSLVINEDNVVIRTTEVNYKELSLFSLIRELDNIYKYDNPIYRLKSAISDAVKGALRFIPIDIKKDPRNKR